MAKFNVSVLVEVEANYSASAYDIVEDMIKKLPDSNINFVTVQNIEFAQAIEWAEMDQDEFIADHAA
mgnify:CR=1 FL=1